MHFPPLGRAEVGLNCPKPLATPFRRKYSAMESTESTERYGSAAAYGRVAGLVAGWPSAGGITPARPPRAARGL